MALQKFKFVILMLISLMMCALFFYSPSQLSVQAQQPTGSIPTVTGTPVGVIVNVDPSLPFVNVYSGPSTYLYPSIGLLLGEQEVSAFGYSEDGNWLQIYYPGVPDAVAWVYAPYMKIKKPGSLPVLGSPSTPTPASTPTIDPTLQAAFIVPVTSTRLPTFTAPAPLSLSSFEENSNSATQVPAGLLIFGLGFIGVLGVAISFLRGR